MCSSDLIAIDSTLRYKIFKRLKKGSHNIIIFRHLFGCTTPQRQTAFAGKVVVFGGDCKQLLPVVPGAEMHEQAHASFKFSAYYEKATVLRLQKNMRVQQGEEEFAMFLKALGNGLIGKPCENGLFMV